jgi:hypothetical protein
VAAAVEDALLVADAMPVDKLAPESASLLVEPDVEAVLEAEFAPTMLLSSDCSSEAALSEPPEPELPEDDP